MNKIKIINHKMKMQFKNIVKSEISYFKMYMHFHNVISRIHGQKI